MTNELKIKVLAIDDGDGLFKYELYVNNGTCSSTIDLYGYSDILTSYGKELTEFPLTLENVSTFEHGEKDMNWTCYVKLEENV